MVTLSPNLFFLCECVITYLLIRDLIKFIKDEWFTKTVSNEVMTEVTNEDKT